MSKVFHFGQSLKQGNRGEDRLLKQFPNLRKGDGRKVDIYTPSGKHIELKSESRTIEETPNLAIEIGHSNGSIGALDRACQDNIDYLVYMFGCGTIFTYNPKQLKEFLDKSSVNFRIVQVKNKSYTTFVKLVPRELVKHLQISFDYE